MSIFNYYPYVQYNGEKATLLLSKAEIIKPYLKDYRKFFNYTVKEGERPDIIAYNEYGDPTLDWVVYVINSIFDPYKDWVMDSEQFKAYMEDKYNTRAELLTTTLIDSSIAYYYYAGIATDDQSTIDSFNYKMTPETYAALNYPAGWIAKSVWDNENEINESKRDIILLRSNYISDFTQQFKDIFKNG
jgi:hypothetical protein